MRHKILLSRHSASRHAHCHAHKCHLQAIGYAAVKTTCRQSPDEVPLLNKQSATFAHVKWLSAVIECHFVTDTDACASTAKTLPASCMALIACHMYA